MTDTTSTHVDRIAPLTSEGVQLTAECLVTEMCHFGAARLWRRFGLFLGAGTVVLAAVSGLIEVGDAPPMVEKYSGWLAIGAAVTASLHTFLDPMRPAESHYSAGCEFSALKSQLRQFVNIDCHDVDRGITKLRKDLADFLNRKNELNKASLQPPGWLFWWTRRRINSQENIFKNLITSSAGINAEK